VDVVLYSLTVFLITSSSSSSASSSRFYFRLVPAVLPISFVLSAIPALATAVLIHLRPGRCFLFFFPMSGLHNASSNPTPSSLSLLLSFVFPHRPPLAPLLIVSKFPPNNNYSAILSAILYRKRKVGGRIKRTRRMSGRIKMERRGRIKFLITLQCQWKKKCEEEVRSVRNPRLFYVLKRDINIVTLPPDYFSGL